MIFVSVFVFVIGGVSNAENDLSYLIDHLDEVVEWTTERRTESLSRVESTRRLESLTSENVMGVTPKHQSNWHQGKSYKIIEVEKPDQTHRLFFHCYQRDGRTVVNRIKITTA
ncbi:MAG: hypothetical protein AAFR14_06015 [Bacteroidota bacterium]